MKKKTIAGLIAIVSIVAVAIFAGCVEPTPPPPTPTPSPTPSPTSSPSSTPTPITGCNRMLFPPEDDSGEIVPQSLKICAPEVILKPADVDKFLDAAKSYGFDTIEMMVKQDEDGAMYGMPDSGYVFYNSSIAPIADNYTNFDALAAMIEGTHKRGMKLYAWAPQFRDKAALELHPEWQMMAAVDGKVVPFTGTDPDDPEFWVNPINPEVQAYEILIMQEVVSNYDIDGMSIDFVRFDEYNMDVSSFSRNLYYETYGIDPIDIDFTTDNPERQQWNEWRKNIIADYIEDVRDVIKAIKPSLPFGVHILPPEMTENAQDVEKFGHCLDYVQPLAYGTAWDKEPSWVWETLVSQARSKVGPEVQIIPALESDMTEEEKEEVLGDIDIDGATVNGLIWFIYEDWNITTLTKIVNALDNSGVNWRE